MTSDHIFFYVSDDIPDLKKKEMFILVSTTLHVLTNCWLMAEAYGVWPPPIFPSHSWFVISHLALDGLSFVLQTRTS